MQQKLILKTAITQTTTTKFTFNVPDIDSLFPGFKAGDFAAIYGSQSVTSLISQLCIRAQLPKQLGGLESKVVFIDAANSSSLSRIFQAAELLRLDSEAVLGQVINIRTYTAYRLTSLIMEKLKDAVEKSGAKLVVISDIVCSFLNDNVDDQEAKAVYSQIMSYLASFAKKHRIIVIATYLSHESNRRNDILQEITSAKANIVLRFTKTLYTNEVELEKHPSYMLGVVDFTSDNQTLTEFASASSKSASISYQLL
jgi:Rad51